MTGVSVSGLCSKDVSYRPVKMSLQPPGAVLSVLLTAVYIIPRASIAVQ